MVRPSATGIVITGSAIREFVRPVRAASSDRPDVFGTVALKVNRTSLDRRWRGVERARIAGRAAVYASSLRNLDKAGRVDAINHYVNRHVKFVDDSRQYRRADVWATANDTLTSGRGDCEDYAIAKLQMLRAAGFSDLDLYLVILKDLVRRSDHAVAVVRSGNRMLVLDNGTDEVLDSDRVTDYRPVLTFAANGAWTHGYKLASAPVELAYAR
jgi:predicted transglutaminase-like cysteine proteinase